MPALPVSGTVMVRSSRSGRCAACASIDCRARLGQMRSVADLHGGRLVHHQQPDIAQGLPGFLHQPGAGQPQQQHGEGGEAEQRAAATAPDAQRHDGQRQDAEDDQDPHRQQRIEADRGDDLFGAHLLAQPLQDGRDVHLVAFVVSGQRIHHEVDAETIRQGPLPLAAGDDGVGVVAVGTRSPRRRPSRCRR